MTGSTRPRFYDLYGLSVRSEIPFAASLSRAAHHDVEVHWGDDLPRSPATTIGRVVAQLTLGRGCGYTHVATPDGEYVLRYEGVCDIVLEASRRTLRVHLAAGGDRRMVPLILAGNTIAFLLTLAGECPLHASAVAVDGWAIAFAGGAGQGKSTLAALLCANGASFVTDDLLRLRETGAAFQCFPGPPYVRLRPNAAGVLTSLSAGAVEHTVDARLAVRLGSAAHGTAPLLGAIVIPRPDRRRTALELERLGRARALLALLRSARLAGLQAAQLRRAQFDGLSRVAQAVPVYEARIPWGPPFAPELAAALCESVLAHVTPAEVTS